MNPKEVFCDMFRRIILMLSLVKGKKMSVKITPEVPDANPDVTKFEDIAAGDSFISDGALLMKSDNDDAVNLDNGEAINFDDDAVVMPVNIDIKWKKAE